MELCVMIGLLLVPDDREKDGSGVNESLKDMHTHISGHCPVSYCLDRWTLLRPRKCPLVSSVFSLFFVLWWFIMFCLLDSDVFSTFVPGPVCLSQSHLFSFPIIFSFFSLFFIFQMFCISSTASTSPHHPLFPPIFFSDNIPILHSQPPPL